MFSLNNLIGKGVIINQRGQVSSKDAIEHENEAKKMIAHFQGEKLDIPLIEAFHFLGTNPHTHEKVSKDAETVIIFMGLNAYHHWAWGYVDAYTQRGVNAVTFNYPGVGNSGGEPLPDEVIQSGGIIVDYLKDSFNIPENRIAAHGHSLGGAFAVQTALKIRGVHIISDRTFSKLSEAIYNIIQVWLKNFPALHFTLNGLRISETPLFLIDQSDWKALDSVHAWEKIEGKKCVFTHLKDPVIRTEVSLFQGLKGKENDTVFITVDDDNSDPHSCLPSPEHFDQILKSIGFCQKC